MKNILSSIIAVTALAFAPILHAGADANADKVVDRAKSVVSYDIDASGGLRLVLTMDYDSKRPTPEIENMDISPAAPAGDGTKTFTIQTNEGVPIEIEYVYSGGKRTDMKISTTPSNRPSEAEYAQILTVKSRDGHSINFTFIWQGADLKEVRIEPQVNPFDAA